MTPEKHGKERFSLNRKEPVFRNAAILSPFGELSVQHIEPRQSLNTVKGKITGLLAHAAKRLNET
jgi:hypothetical protein